MFLLFFCLDAKEKVTKEKIKAALFWLLRSGIPLKKKNSLLLFATLIETLFRFLY